MSFGSLGSGLNPSITSSGFAEEPEQPKSAAASAITAINETNLRKIDLPLCAIAQLALESHPVTNREPKLILASSSPRRRSLLEAAGLRFEVIPSHIPEEPRRGESPRNYTMRLARAKASQVGQTIKRGLIIGADTIVVLDDKILEKPTSREDARAMLRLLSGRWHSVITGVALCEPEMERELVDYEETRVKFAQLEQDEIQWYTQSDEPLDKAGAYAIQGRASLFVERIEGDYQNVVGLPVRLVYRLARQLGYSLEDLS